MTLGGTAQVAAAQCPNEWTLHPVLTFHCKQWSPTRRTWIQFLLRLKAPIFIYHRLHGNHNSSGLQFKVA